MGGIDCILDIPSVNSSSAFLWVSEPAFRGTLDIISLCFSTIVVCVWSSLHLDILSEPLPSRKSNLDAVIWLVAALLFPDLVFYYAVRQYVDAKFLCNLYKKFERPERVHPFTVVHGFYATMGGYWFSVPGLAQDQDQANSEPEKRGESRFRITPLGMQFLMEHDIDLIPDLSEKSITYRSQSGSLNKALLIFQVFRFCLNCGSRLGRHFPLSLLEVTTAAHGICTLATYFVWWSKPRNVDEPTLIPELNAQTTRSAATTPPPAAEPADGAREACALMRMLSVDNLRNQLREAIINLRMPVGSQYLESSHFSVSGPSGTSPTYPPTAQAIPSINPTVPASDSEGVVEASSAGNLLLDLALKAANRYNLTTLEKFDDLSTQKKTLAPTYYVLEADASLTSLTYPILCFQYLFRPVKNFDLNFGSVGVQDLRRIISIVAPTIIIWMVMSLYRTVHFLAWNAHFPKSTLRLVWRLVCTLQMISAFSVHSYRVYSIEFTNLNRGVRVVLSLVIQALIIFYFFWVYVILEAILDQIRVQNESDPPRRKSEAARQTLRQIYRDLIKAFHPQVIEKRMRIFNKFSRGLTLCIVILLIPCTLFIVIESIHQLFYLPPGAYEVPSWYTYFRAL